MNQMTTCKSSLLEDVISYHESEIEAIGLWRPKLAEFGEERAVELLKDLGMSVSSVSWAGGFTGSNGHSYHEAVDDTLEAIRLSAELNAECLVIISGARAGHTSNHARRLLVDALTEIADAAAEHHLTLAVLPMDRMFSREWTFLHTLDATLDVLSQTNHPNVRMAFDVYHLWQEPRLIERMPEIVPYIAMVQLSDWREPPRSDNDRALLGDGQIPLEQIVAALIDSGYQGYFEIQIWSAELWDSDYFDLIRLCRSRFESLCSGTLCLNAIPQ